MPPVADALVDAAVDAGRPDFGAGADPPLTDEMAAAVADFDGEVSVYVRNLVTGDAVAESARVRRAAGGLSALLVAVAYADRVEAGTARPDELRTLRPGDLRGGGITGIGGQYALDDLMNRALAGDRTAEQVVVDALGGSDAVNAVVVGTDIDEIGRYLDPCERDRAFATALDARFAEVDCPELAAWVHQGDSAGIVPLPFPTAPTFDAGARAAAAAARLTAGPGTVTARGWARLLSRLDDDALLGPAVDARVRALLDDSRATGGGDDALPASIWSGSLEGATEDGRHWVGRVRTADDESVAVVVLTAATEEPVAALTRSLGAGGWRAVVGETGSWPPEPRGVEGQLALMAAAEAVACDTGGFDERSACMLDNMRATFAPEEDVTAVVLLRTPEGAEVATTFAEPNGTRTRLQKRLSPSGWWAWSENRTVRVEGEWSVTVTVDGRPLRPVPFVVDEMYRRE
ncbi:MAG: serine hydrolase [bacterium]